MEWLPDSGFAHDHFYIPAIYTTQAVFGVTPWEEAGDLLQQQEKDSSQTVSISIFICLIFRRFCIATTEAHAVASWYCADDSCSLQAEQT